MSVWLAIAGAGVVAVPMLNVAVRRGGIARLLAVCTAIAGLNALAVYVWPGLSFSADRSSAVALAVAQAVATLLALSLAAAFVLVQVLSRYTRSVRRDVLGRVTIIYALILVVAGILYPLWVALEPSPSRTRFLVFSASTIFLSLLPFLQWLTHRLRPTWAIEEIERFASRAARHGRAGDYATGLDDLAAIVFQEPAPDSAVVTLAHRCLTFLAVAGVHQWPAMQGAVLRALTTLVSYAREQPENGRGLSLTTRTLMETADTESPMTLTPIARHPRIADWLMELGAIARRADQRALATQALDSATTIVERHMSQVTEEGEYSELNAAYARAVDTLRLLANPTDQDFVADVRRLCRLPRRMFAMGRCPTHATVEQQLHNWIRELVHHRVASLPDAADPTHVTAHEQARRAGVVTCAEELVALSAAAFEVEEDLRSRDDLRLLLAQVSHAVRAADDGACAELAHALEDLERRLVPMSRRTRASDIRLAAVLADLAQECGELAVALVDADRTRQIWRLGSFVRGLPSAVDADAGWVRLRHWKAIIGAANSRDRRDDSLASLLDLPPGNSHPGLAILSIARAWGDALRDLDHDPPYRVSRLAHAGSNDWQRQSVDGARAGARVGAYLQAVLAWEAAPWAPTRVWGGEGNAPWHVPAPDPAPKLTEILSKWWSAGRDRPERMWGTWPAPPTMADVPWFSPDRDWPDRTYLGTLVRGLFDVRVREVDGSVHPLGGIGVDGPIGWGGGVGGTRNLADVLAREVLAPAAVCPACFGGSLRWPPTEPTHCELCDGHGEHPGLSALTDKFRSVVLGWDPDAGWEATRSELLDACLRIASEADL